MKKLVFISFSVFFALSSFSQKGKITSADLYVESYYRGEGTSKDLEEAQKNIDMATKDETTMNMGKTWWVRAKVYQAMAKDSTYTKGQTFASIEAIKSYQKLIELNDPKFKDWEAVTTSMKEASLVLFNQGVEAFGKKRYHDAYIYFSHVSIVSDMVVAKGQKIKPEVLYNGLVNAAYSAENDADYTNADLTYKKMIVIAADTNKPKVYYSWISMLKKGNKIEEAKKVADEAIAKFPSDKDLLLAKINFYLSEQKYQEAINYLKQAVSLDPKNESVQSALGIAYEQVGDSANALKVYQNIYSQNAQSFDANYGLGSLIVTKAKAIQNEMNDIKGVTKADDAKYAELKKKRNAMFIEAKFYLAKAYDIKSSNPRTKDTKPTPADIQSSINRMNLLLKE